MAGEKNTLITLASHPVVQGTVIALVVSLTGILLLSLVFYATTLSETYLQPSGNILYLAGAFLGGFVSAKKAGRKGMQLGLAAGFFYFLVIVAVIPIFAPSAFSWPALIPKGIFSLIVAAVGGIFGIAFAD